MQPDAWIQIALRALPAIILVVLGFLAASDQKSREQWNSVLYQIGSLRPDQKEDQNIGRGVKWPFFVVALAFLFWPINYFRLATRTFEVKSDIYTTKRKAPTIYDRKTDNAAGSTPGANNAAANTTTNAASGPPVHGDSPSNTAVNSATGTAPGGSGKNIYGQDR